MLQLWINHEISDWRIITLPSRSTVKSIYKKEWSTGKWTNYISTKVDKTPLIKDYCFESPIFGQIAPESLSTGAIALIIMAHEPNTIMPMSWLGDNCIPVLADMCKELDCTASFGDRWCNMSVFDKIHILDTNDTINGKDFMDFILNHKDLNNLAQQGMLVAEEVSYD